MEARLDGLKSALAGHYVLERELGHGGMATVYLAEDVKHHRKVAVKVLRPELAASLGPDRFVREIAIAATLSHPHVLPLFDSGEADGTLYYVMPFVEGESLRERLERDGKLTVDEAIRLTDQVASALSYAHVRGVVHRDIKPENILLSGDQAVVADFGIAHAIEMAGNERLTGTGLAIGTPAYMSPEQATASGDLDARTDVYALGCLVHEMVTGSPPFEGATPQALIAKHMVDAVPSLRKSDPSIPLFVDRAVARALAKDREDRFESAAALAEALRSGTVVARVRRRHVVRRWQIGAALILVATVTWWLTNLTGTPGVRALAVLPLTNLTGDTAQEYFIDGVHESLISELAQTGVTVKARTSVMRYRGTNKTLAEIARDLNVDAVLEGGVFRDGDSVEIETRLIDPRSEVPLWQGAYEGNLPNVVALYRGIARAIAVEIGVVLSPEQEERLSQVSEVNPDVYEAYLRGMHHLNLRTPEDIQLGLQYLHDAVDRNPVDAQAWAALAKGYMSIGHSFAPTVEARTRATEAAERAVKLDPMLADGWSALATVKTYYEHDWEGAERAFLRANELNPSLPMARYHYAWYLDLFDRLDEAIVEHERAKELDPFTPLHTAWLGVLYERDGRVEDGIAEARLAMTLQPGSPIPYLALGVIYQRAGRDNEAVEAFEQAAAMAPPIRGFLGRAYAKVGRTDDALAIAAELEAAPNAMAALTLARIYTILGDYDKALDWYEYRPSHVWLPWALTQEVPPDLRQHPRQQALLRGMDLQQDR
jgi:TolB-like protein/tetratricopeptide (TPR) repeat protein/tRNA A-37 threonylcarbamoyl transferase component Bud32